MYSFQLVLTYMIANTTYETPVISINGERQSQAFPCKYSLIGCDPQRRFLSKSLKQANHHCSICFKYVVITTWTTCRILHFSDSSDHFNTQQPGHFQILSETRDASTIWRLVSLVSFILCVVVFYALWNPVFHKEVAKGLCVIHQQAKLLGFSHLVVPCGQSFFLLVG